MAVKAKSVVIFLAIYLLIFWVGFRAGEISNRIKKGHKLERIAVPNLAQERAVFYMVEHRDSFVEFSSINSDSAIMKMYNNEKLRPLLKLKKVEIYDSKGDRIY